MSSVVQVPTMPASTIATVPMSTVSTTTYTQALPTTTMAPVAPATTTLPFVPIVSQDGGPNYEIELKKRLLDGQRELKEKQADMEADKEKKLEEKADKHRTKAVKWIGRGFPSMATRHESKATALDVKANEHFMAAEQLRLQAKAIDKERKSYDPPKEERKKPAAKTAVMKKPAAAAPVQKTTTTQHTPAGQQQRTVTQRPAAVAAPGAAPSLHKEAVPAAAPLHKETRTETAPIAPSLTKEAAPLKQETKIEQKPVGDAEAPVVEEIKTEKIEADGEKKEEKQHHILHKEKNSSGTPSH